MRIQKQKTKLRRVVWFTAVRGSYLPANWKGWATYVPFVAYLVFTVFAAVDYTGDNVKAVLWIVPNWVAATVVMTWIAQRKS